VRAAIASQPAKISHAVAIQILAEHLTLNTENCPQTPGKPITVIGTAAIRDAFVVGGFQKKSELF